MKAASNAATASPSSRFASPSISALAFSINSALWVATLWALLCRTGGRSVGQGYASSLKAREVPPEIRLGSRQPAQPFQLGTSPRRSPDLQASPLRRPGRVAVARRLRSCCSGDQCAKWRAFRIGLTPSPDDLLLGKAALPHSSAPSLGQTLHQIESASGGQVTARQGWREPSRAHGFSEPVRSLRCAAGRAGPRLAADA